MYFEGIHMPHSSPHSFQTLDGSERLTNNETKRIRSQIFNVTRVEKKNDCSTGAEVERHIAQGRGVPSLLIWSKTPERMHGVTVFKYIL